MTMACDEKYNCTKTTCVVTKSNVQNEMSRLLSFDNDEADDDDDDDDDKEDALLTTEERAVIPLIREGEVRLLRRIVTCFGMLAVVVVLCHNYSLIAGIKFKLLLVLVLVPMKHATLISSALPCPGVKKNEKMRAFHLSKRSVTFFTTSRSP